MPKLTAIGLQLLFHPLDPSDVKAINQQQMKGGTPDPSLIQDPEIRRLTEKFNLMEEMFGNKAAGQVEANKQVLLPPKVLFVHTCHVSHCHPVVLNVAPCVPGLTCCLQQCRERSVALLMPACLFTCYKAFTVFAPELTMNTLFIWSKRFLKALLLSDRLVSYRQVFMVNLWCLSLGPKPRQSTRTFSTCKSFRW